MAGLVPAIDALPAHTELVDARVKHSLASDQFRPASEMRTAPYQHRTHRRRHLSAVVPLITALIAFWTAGLQRRRRSA